MNDARLWLAGITVLPALVIGASYFRMDVERLRRLAVASAAIMLLATFVIAVSPQLRTLSIRTTALSWLTEGEAVIRIDALSSVLLPFAAGLWVLTVAVTPRAALDRGGLRRTALATLLTVASFLTESAVLLSGLELSRRGSPAKAREMFLDFERKSPNAVLLPELRLAIAAPFASSRTPAYQ